MAKKKVAAVITEYRLHSHADVIVGKILEGFNYDGGTGPNMQLVSMYVDQFPKEDRSRDLARKYGFHGLESLQCMVERRKGGESGVRWVECLQGEEMWKALDQGRWSKTLLEAALKLVPAHAPGDYREPTAKSKDAAVFLLEYRAG